MIADHSILILAEDGGWIEFAGIIGFVALSVIASVVKSLREKADERKAQEAKDTQPLQMKKAAKTDESPWQPIESPKPPKIKLSRGRPSQPTDRDGLFAQLQQSQPVQGIGAAMAELTPIAPLKPEPKPAVRRPQPVVRKRGQSGSRTLLKQQPDPILESSLSESDSHIHIRVAMSASMAKKGIILQEILSQPIALRE
jgi:hypothetical protein